MPYVAAILIALLIVSPGIAGAHAKDQRTGPGDFQNVTAFRAHKMIEKGDVFILDVRTPNEYKYSHIEGAKLIPLRNVPAHDPVQLSDDKLLPKRMKELPKDKHKVIVVYCYSGKRGFDAGKMIADAGYKRVYNINDEKAGIAGLPAWVKAGYPVVIDYDKWASIYPHT
jgi:rhodanese-related sulfurtransferase